MAFPIHISLRCQRSVCGRGGGMIGISVKLGVRIALSGNIIAH